MRKKKTRLHPNVIQRHLFVIGIKNHFGIFNDFISEYTTLYTSVECKGTSPTITVKVANIKENTVFFSAFLLYFGHRYVYQVPECNLAKKKIILYYFFNYATKASASFRHDISLHFSAKLSLLQRCYALLPPATLPRTLHSAAWVLVIIKWQ